MAIAVNPLSEISSVTVDTAARLTRISMDSAERVLALQLEFAKSTVDRATKNARAAAGAKDVQELLQVRTRNAESAMEQFLGYSRSLYEVASEAQTELSRLAQERMTRFQAAVTQTVDEAAKNAPAGGDIAVAAIKQSLAATTAAFDSFNKAARHVASYSDATVRSQGARKPRK